jgi:MHS family alpha-ketoglutarate permease-like MFS transporter
MATSSLTPPPSRIRAIVAASVGNALEWFDWTVYATFAIFFSSQFFPSENDTAALLAAYGVFAVGFIMRPLGGWIIGVYADRQGRKAALAISVFMMAGGSLVIGLSPTYAQVGIVSPLILICARLVQGLSLGGLYASATTLLAEIAPDNRRGFYSSFVFFSLAAGILVASALGWALTTNLTEEAMRSWGWRVPFMLGGVGGLIGLWIRSAVAEPEASPVSSGQDVVKQPLRVLIKDHPVALLRIVGFAVLTTFAFYIFVPYLPTYAVREAGAEASVAFAANTVGLIVFMLVQPLFGALSDRIGRKPQLIVFALGYLVFFYPLMSGIQPTFSSLLLLQLFGLVLYAMYSSIAPAIMSEQFPGNVRAVGIGVPYNLTVALLGGLTPYVLTWLQSRGNEQLFFVVVLVGAVVTLVTFLQMPEKAGQPLD